MERVEEGWESCEEEVLGEGEGPVDVDEEEEEGEERAREVAVRNQRNE